MGHPQIQKQAHPAPKLNNEARATRHALRQTLIAKPKGPPFKGRRTGHPNLESLATCPVASRATRLMNFAAGVAVAVDSVGPIWSEKYYGQ
jgi:hypothetical protein